MTEPQSDAQWPPPGTEYALADIVLATVDEITGTTDRSETVTMENVLLTRGDAGLWTIMTKDCAVSIHERRIWEIRMRKGSKSYDNLLKAIQEGAGEYEEERRRMKQQKAESKVPFQ